MSKAHELLKQAIAIFKTDVEGMQASERYVYGVLVVAHLVAHVYETESRDGTDAERAELKQDLLNAFHELFVQIDIPYVPKSMEVLVESLLTQPLANGLDVLGAKFAEFRAKIDELVNKVT